MIGWVLEGVQRFFWWLIDTIVGIFFPLIEAMIDALPDDLQTKIGANVGQLQALLNFADYWFPIVECIGMVILYWTFVIFWSATKILIKLIPTIG